MSQIFKPSAGSVGPTGDVVGPASSTDNAIVRFDGLTGKLIQNSVAILSDTGALTGVTAVTVVGPITMTGAQIIKVTVPGAYPYTVLATDYFVAVDTTSARTISLPNATLNAGQQFVIKDITGNAGSAVMTINCVTGGQTIDGTASITINGNYDAYVIVSNGTNYFTM
jgi:hypothetical protein